MLHSYYRDYELNPTNKSCPACDRLLQLLVPKGDKTLLNSYYLCSNEHCNFLGADDVTQVIAARQQLKDLKVELVDFSVDTVRTYLGRAVNFNEHCFGFIPKSVKWSFGDGTELEGQNATTHTYNQLGSFDITLTVQHPKKGELTLVKKNLVNVLEYLPLNPNFSVDKTTGEDQLQVQFKDESEGSEIVGWEWDFGDGTGQKSYVQHPLYFYRHVGNFSVSLKIINSKGESKTQVKSNLITLKYSKPTVTFTSHTQNGYTNDPIRFISKTTGYIESITWDFGDGQTSTDENPVHTYTTPGVYTIKCVVRNSSGEGDFIRTNYIAIRDFVNLEPDIMVIEGPNSLPSTYQFSAEASIGEIIEYRWFKNGLFLNNSIKFSENYTSPEVSEYKLQLKDTRGNLAEKTYQLNFLSNWLPVADFEFMKSEDNSREFTFTFNGTGKDLQYVWYCDDKALEHTTSSFKYTFPEDKNSFNIRLEITNIYGTSQKVKTIIIE